MSAILQEINEKANHRYSLYLKLGQMISDGYAGFSDDRVQEIQGLTSALVQLWANRRAEGKVWMPRLREGKSNQGDYQRRLSGSAHKYGRH